jgi:hypothetical protein
MARLSFQITAEISAAGLPCGDAGMVDGVDDHGKDETGAGGIADEPNCSGVTPRIGIAHDAPGVAGGFQRPVWLDVGRTWIAFRTTPDVSGIFLIPPQLVDHDYIVTHLHTREDLEME